ncbi:MAG: BON domain-containing protein [Gammaproteobacteria bacterium]|nr:BON domain-containing protein [Gammaproteobacteria bacterium]
MQNKEIIKSSLMMVTALAMSACSTVRDTTDWVPGVSSNEEIAAEKRKEAAEAAEREREAYENKTVFAPTTRTASASDASINVNIGQQYATETKINREDIGIEVNAGVVTLTGNVDSDESAVNAIAIAKSTAGVSRVISKLVVVNVRNKGRVQVELPASNSKSK